MSTIFIAEDEPHIIRVTRLALERSGYVVNHAHNGKDALESIIQSPPDALITDISMPVMDGRGLCESIERHFGENHFPIFVLTSKTDIEHREWSRNLKNVTFMEKPASLRQLISKIDEKIQRKAA